MALDMRTATQDGVTFFAAADVVAYLRAAAAVLFEEQPDISPGRAISLCAEKLEEALDAGQT